MENFVIFLVQVTFSLIIWGLLARWFVMPRLASLSLSTALIVLIVPHALRQLGLNFLVTGVTNPALLPSSFTLQVAVGDVIATVLALLAMVALRSRWSFALLLVWIFNIEGFLDLMNAYLQGTGLVLGGNTDWLQGIGAAWYIPTIWVPLLIVSHILIFILLLRKSPQNQPTNAK